MDYSESQEAVDAVKVLQSLDILEHLKADELRDIAKKLEIKQRSKLIKEKLTLAIIRTFITKNYTKEQVDAVLVDYSPAIREALRRDRREKIWKRAIEILYIAAALLTIVGTIYMLIPSKPDKLLDRNIEEVKKELEKKYVTSDEVQPGPEYEKKIEELEAALKDERFGNNKRRNAALKALKQGNLAEAQTLFQEFSETDKVKERWFARTRYILGNIYYLQLQYEEALKTYKEGGRLHPDSGQYLDSIGLVYLELGKYPEAGGYFERALARDIETHGQEHPNVAIRLSNLGLALYELGEYQQTIKNFEKALAIDKKAYGEEHIEVASDLNNLGMAWYAFKQYERAIEYYEKALTIDTKIHGADHTEVATILSNLGCAYTQLEKYQQAINYFKRALTIDEKTYGKDHPEVALDLNNLGHTLGALGQYQQAIKHLERAANIFINKYGETHPKVAAAWNNMGLALHGLKEYQRAVDLYKKALKIYEKELGSDHPETKKVRENLEKAEKKPKGEDKKQR